jgi:hypothetical protein
MVENTFFFSYTVKLGIVRHRSHAQCSDGVINLSQSPDRSCVNERFALFGSALPLPQFHVSFCNPHIGREGKTPDEYLANDSLFYWQACHTLHPAQALLAARRDALVFSSKTCRALHMR